MADPVYSFEKVEDFFTGYKSWTKLGNVLNHSYDPDIRTLTLIIENGYPQGQPCCLLIQLLGYNVFRVRFDPSKRSSNEYITNNTRAVVMDTWADLQNEWGQFITNFNDGQDTINVDTIHTDNTTQFMRIEVNLKPFSIRVYRFEGGQLYTIWSTNEEIGLRWVEVKDQVSSSSIANTFKIIQVVNKPATAKYTGFGEHGGVGLFKNSQQLTFFNYDNYGYNQIYGQGPLDQREPLYHSDPFFIEFNGVPGKKSVNGMYIDNYSLICMDIGYEKSDRNMFGIKFGELDYYVFAGNECKDIIGSFTSLVGRCRLKPRYVLGYHQGCYGWMKRQDVEDILQGYRKNNIPIDGLHIDIDAQNNFEVFTLDPINFPNPKEMFDNFRRNGAKCCTNITPIIKKGDSNYMTYKEALMNRYVILDQRTQSSSGDLLQQYYEGGRETIGKMIDDNPGGPYVGMEDYGNGSIVMGHYPDLGRKEVRDWWGQQYENLFSLGLEFVWQDMTTPAIDKTRGDMKGFPFKLLVTDDSLSSTPPKLSPAIKAWNLFSYNLHKATYHGLNLLPGRAGKRNFIIGRGSFTGSHRFCGLWTGDNASTWDFYRINIAQVLAVGLSGLSIVGADIGGFGQSYYGERWASPELIIRWTTAGSFLPWFRNHYVRHDQKWFQELYIFKDHQNDTGVTDEQRVFYRAVLPVTRHYIELRYRLMQLWYDLMWENVLESMPLCRAMFINDPQDTALYNDKIEFNSNQFFVGKDLLVAPIMNPGDTRRDIYLPVTDYWYSFMDSIYPLAYAVEGGTTIRGFDAHIDGDDCYHLGFHVPVYIRAGAIIPEIPLEQWVGQLHEIGKPCNITLNIYPGTRGNYTMYLDDGVSLSSAPPDAPQYHYLDSEEKKWVKGEYREVKIEHIQSGTNRDITISRGRDNYTPPLETFYRVAILHDPVEPRQGSNGPLMSITVNKQVLSSPNKDIVISNDNSNPVNSWYYETSINTTYIKVVDTNMITINLKYYST
ncbi:12573_t:CDS:2 [Gigaspora margarita]|uniref:12573_t:CDS:1 n=1 Tax=Gigaspora margarita TaxID=4874 RepID=A0ABN7VDH6_GIGMA|nr:12573_t:CDS:2 [Gigaspora margarita]